jgi:esterase/lipase superfamily enzyme
METLHFGDRGRVLVAFPISMGRFHLWEDNGLVDALAPRLDAGDAQLLCVDSIDEESWYAEDKAPAARVRRHLAYERYLLDEVLAGLDAPPVCVGASFGAFHSALLALRHPDRVAGFVAMSGVFDNSRWLDGYHDEDTYLTNVLAFVPHLHEDRHLAPIRAMDLKVIVTGTDDANAGESVALADALRGVGITVSLHLLPGWLHDWPYWREMLRAHV